MWLSVLSYTLTFIKGSMSKTFFITKYILYKNNVKLDFFLNHEEYEDRDHGLRHLGIVTKVFIQILLVICSLEYVITSIIMNQIKRGALKRPGKYKVCNYN